MYEKFYRVKRMGAVAIGLAIASLSTLSTTALAAGELQLPEIDSIPAGQTTNNGAGAQQSLPTEDSALAKISSGLDTLYFYFVTFNSRVIFNWLARLAYIAAQYLYAFAHV